jgi:hypothetical protein
MLHQPTDDIAAHPAQTDHAELHFDFPWNLDLGQFKVTSTSSATAID